MTTTITWDVDADGNWSTGANWDLNQIPINGDNVVIDTTGLRTVTYDGGTVAVASLDVGNDNFVVSNGALTVTGVSTFDHNLSVTGGTFTANGNLTVSGTTSISAGELAVTALGTTNTKFVGTTNLSGGMLHILSGTGASVTSLTQSGGNIAIDGSSALSIGTYTLGAGAHGLISGTGSVSLNLSINNTSQLLMTGSGASHFNLLNGSKIVYLDGGRTLSSSASTLTMRDSSQIYLGHNPFGASLGGATISGSVTFDYDNVRTPFIAGTGALHLKANISNIGDGETHIVIPYEGGTPASVEVHSGMLAFDAGGSIDAANLDIYGGTLALNSGGQSSTFTIVHGIVARAGGTIMLGGGRLQMDGGIQFKPHLVMTGNSIIGGGTGANFRLTGGAEFGTGQTTLAQQLMSGGGHTYLYGASTLMGSGAFYGRLYLDANRILENTQTFTIGNGSSLFLGTNPFGTTHGDADFINAVGATLNFEGSLNTAVIAGAGTLHFVNNGTLNKNGAGETDIGVRVVNTGNINVHGGVLKISGAVTDTGAIAVDSGASFILDAASDAKSSKMNIAGLTHGAVTLNGGIGSDIFTFAAVRSTDTVNGGTGAHFDTLVFSSRGTFTATDIAGVSHIETIQLGDGGTSSITLTDALIASSDNNHRLAVNGGTGADTIDASASTVATHRVTFYGAGAADILTTGNGSDVFLYAGASDSTSVNYDTINGFNFDIDRFNTPGGGGTITKIDPALTSGLLDSGANFDTQLTTAMSGHLGAHHAELFTPDSGTLAGETFLIVDLNGAAGYQTGADLVLHMEGMSGTLAKGDFV